MSLLERLALRLGRLLSWSFVAITVIITTEVVARYVFDRPTFWAHETTIALAGLAFIFGGAYCMADRSHMRITVLTERFGPRGQRVTDVLASLVAVVYLGGLTWAATRMAVRSLWRFSADGIWIPERTGSYWNPPIPGFLNLALAMGSALFLLIVLIQLVQLVRTRIRED